VSTKHRFIPETTPEELQEIQTEGLKWTLGHAAEGCPAYAEKFKSAGLNVQDIQSLDDLQKLPFTSVDDLKDGYPFPLLSVPEGDVVRIHASSGTTGKRKVMSYTQRDIEVWQEMFARCYELAGMDTTDRVQIAVGYGLWTAGAGFQLGCERFGAMALPVGPGNLEIQMQIVTDMQPTCLCSTSSMALLMGEEVEKGNLRDTLALKYCIFGAETHSEKMRRRFEDMLGLEHSFDIVGMTELYGPGTGLECRVHQGIHYWADIFILEIINPDTLEPVEPGEVGEMVVTTLRKEASPLIRYRTRDLTRLLPEPCPCGVTMPRHDKILGRSDDMIIFRGVNIYPGQIAEVLERFPEIDSEYRIHLTREGGRDVMDIKVERRRDAANTDAAALAKAVTRAMKSGIMVSPRVELVDPGDLPRSFAKTKRVQDDRN
jgi:phenylacetate-CoA ligase